jgi:hypothetical protein
MYAYPLDMQEEIETIQKGASYLRSIGVPYDALDALFSVPQGTVKRWIYRGVDAFHPLLMSGWYKPTFCFALLLGVILGIWEWMQKETIGRITADQTWDAQNQRWKMWERDILSLGGVAPSTDPGGDVTLVPNNLIRSGGLRPERLTQALADYFPIYGVKNERDFYDACDLYADHQAARRLKGANHDQ